MQNYKPLYLWSLEEAIRNNEKDLWRESYKENCDCARAIEKAIGFHVPIEIDVCLTKDKKLIVFHDNNLKRMTGKNFYVEDLTLEEIGKFFLGSSLEVIPTLDEVLKLVNGKVLLNIEVKSSFNNDEICNLLYEQLDNYQGDVIVVSALTKPIVTF